MTRLEMEIRGKSPEEQYEFIRWLFYDYSSWFTSSSVAIIEWLSQEVDDVDEWCYDCKEFDLEHHCCQRWNKIIRQAVDLIKGGDDIEPASKS
jgi:hypothetical protein